MTDHFRNLAEFVRGVELAGGTTPHVAMTVDSMNRLDDPLEKLWFAGCYALTYNWPTAERIFLEWRPEDFDQLEFLMWAEENWTGIALRKERKAVFRKPFFAESAASYLAFARQISRWTTFPDDYAAAYSLFDQGCRYMGRYIAIRWLEVMRRAFPEQCSGWVMPDIHSDGGQHPRKALALIYPEDADALLGGNSKREIAVADLAAERCLLDLEIEFGVKTDMYTLQSLTCEYKQSILGRKHWPGRSIDTEMDYHRKIYNYWGAEKQAESAFYLIREERFPEWSLGEKQGWDGIRPELGAVLADYGYTWSDWLYLYRETADFSCPVLRDPRVTSLLES